MKFFCEYCGCRIDAESHDKCPNCGASYRKNATFIRLEKEKAERVDKINEFQDKVLEHTATTFKMSKIVFIIPIIAFIVIFIIVISGFMRTSKTYNSLNSNIIDPTTESKTNDGSKETKSVTVNGLNVYGEISEYGVKVTSYEDVTFWYKEPQQGYKFVKFYLEVENLSNKEIDKENVNCIVNGVAQTNEFTSGYSTLPFFISKDLTVKGEATFEVPINATSYDIKYGDYITIHIEK